jgi:hypothetical protein
MPAEDVIFHLRLRPAAGVDATRALRRLLKFALRRCGLKCLAGRAEPQSHCERARPPDRGNRSPARPSSEGRRGAGCWIVRISGWIMTKILVPHNTWCGHGRCHS